MKSRFIIAALGLLAVMVTGGWKLPDSTPFIPVCQIQGSGLSSPYLGRHLWTEGVVTADFDAGGRRMFFLQAPACDGNPATSDGIRIYLSESIDLVRTGDWVAVRGVVNEYYGQTELLAAPGDVSLSASGQALPAAIELDPPFELAAAKLYFEARESMRVRLGDGLVVGPTSARGQTWLVRSDLGLARVFAGDARGTGEIIALSADGYFRLLPDARSGDRVWQIEGVLDYSLGDYQVLLTGQPILLPGTFEAGDMPELSGAVLSAASLNLANLFDTVDDPNRDDSVPTASAYHRKLEKLALLIRDGLREPALLGVQEAETGAVLAHLANRPELSTDYGVVWVDGPDQRGIDVGLLYDQTRFLVLEYQAQQACTRLLDGLGPDGNRDPRQPLNALTCDSDGNGSLDGNRLFSRPPLLVRLLDLESVPATELWVLVLHWKSKVEDTSSQAYTAPRRLEQAQFSAGLVAQILAQDPAAAVLVLGDLNDLPASAPWQALQQVNLLDLTSRVAPGQRYTYIHAGISQVLDYVLVSPALHLLGSTVNIPHLNADYPAVFAESAGTAIRSSDHDAVQVAFFEFKERIFLPLIAH
ncbi:MAG: hypothetical protein JW862_11375 [Anaerolineales bacterium]|nr:hypothetical protein [Anaerolineales bacterium]